MRVAFNINERNKLEQNSFNSIVVMKINVIFEFNSINSSSADTNLERKHQPRHLNILSKILAKVASWLKRNKKGKYLGGSGEKEKRRKIDWKKREGI